MNDRPYRLLILEDNPEIVGLLEEAFTEMQEIQYSRVAAASWERVYALDVNQASGLLDQSKLEQSKPGRSEFDGILLDVDSGNPRGLPAFLRLQSQVPQVPVVALAALPQEALGLSLVRQGAQDCLILEELDCIPLAHSLRCSIERNRLSQGLRLVSLTDDLTGLYNRRGFLKMTGRDSHLIQSFGLHAVLALVRCVPPTVGQRAGSWDGQAMDLFTIQLAEGLRELSQRADLLARLDDDTFALFGLTSTAEGAQERVRHLQSGLRYLQGAIPGNGLATLRIMTHLVGASFSVEDILESAQDALCENSLVANSAGCYL